ncbi:cytochrome c-type biogenesis protein CcmH [Bacillus sp. T3]|uniref:cytochrome c-type biogenesis protein CcmH n=1 Tax=Bacillus sp. T3 TaxID=467262 RepID=UPI002981D93C|nr:cytochrome c-type biogenesis protein CcmH [Bacillus sp. T3]
MMKRVFMVTIFIVVMVPSLALAAFTVNSKEFRHVIEQLDMQGHADHELSTCTVKKVYYEEVIDMLNEGKSEEEIIQSYVDEYGQAALRTPGNDLGGILAWLMPAMGLVIGIVIVFITMKKITLKRSNQHEEIDVWQSEIDRELFEKTMDVERRKFF